MLFTSIKRITRTGFVNFWRNGFLSFAAIVVITLSLCAFGALIFASVSTRTLLADVKEKVDINVYFALNAPEADMKAFQKEIDSLATVSETTYMSRDTVLANFKDKWKDNSLIMQGLDEIGSNPFPAMLNIRAKDPAKYGSIAQYILDKNPEDSTGTPIIEKVNYEENRLIIDRLTRMIPIIEKSGLVLALILVIVAAIVIFNTIRLITFTARDEISVMKLVGASNIYVRGPLVVSGIMYGVFSAVLTLIIMAVFAYWSDAMLLRIAGVQVAADLDMLVNVLSKYFIQNFAQIFVIIMGAGIVLGGVSSYIAARRYLKV
jgi:cell division transport system permease protein